MFDFAWSEIALIGVVALIAIGPKDMPGAIRTASSMIKKARRMASEFQTHVDEMVREADLGDVKKAFSDIRNLDIPSLLEKHVDPDRSIRSTFQEDPFKPAYPTAGEDTTLDGEVSTLDEVTVSASPLLEAQADPALAVEPETAVEPHRALAPAFIPPSMVPSPEIPAAATPHEPPAFIPPEAVLQRRSKT